MTGLLLVALGGAAGACARFWLSGLVGGRLGEGFPWGTLAVNVSGAFAIGLCAALLPLPPDPAAARSGPWLLLVTGVLASYTTVSSFSLQTLALAQAGLRGRALVNILASFVLCLGAAAAGLALGRALWAG